MQVYLFRYWKENAARKYDVYLLPKQLDEQMSILQLPALGAMPTVCAEEHADCLGVKLEGPFKPARTRSTSWQNTSMSKWRHCTFSHSVQSSTSSPRLKPLVQVPRSKAPFKVEHSWWSERHESRRRQASRVVPSPLLLTVQASARGVSEARPCDFQWEFLSPCRAEALQSSTLLRTSRLTIRSPLGRGFRG